MRGNALSTARVPRANATLSPLAGERRRGGKGTAAASFLEKEIAQRQLVSPLPALPRKGGGSALSRETKFANAELSGVEADGSFFGYASLFGETDLNRDLVMRGAFQKSIGKRGAGGIRMLFQHDPAAPIGVWTEVREDFRGLFVRGRLMTEVAKGREVLALMRAGAIDGLSIGFRTVRGRTDAKSGVRHLIEVDLWEVSVVTFPMLPQARVRGVKTMMRPAELLKAIRRGTRMMRSERH